MLPLRWIGLRRHSDVFPLRKKSFTLAFFPCILQRALPFLPPAVPMLFQGIDYSLLEDLFSAPCPEPLISLPKADRGKQDTIPLSSSHSRFQPVFFSLQKVCSENVQNSPYLAFRFSGIFPLPFCQQSNREPFEGLFVQDGGTAATRRRSSRPGLLSASRLFRSSSECAAERRPRVFLLTSLRSWFISGRITPQFQPV